MTSIARPDPREAAEYYFTYINKVPAGDIRELLSQQLPDTLALLSTISEDASQYRYAPRKWSVRQVLNHVNDAERLFAFRAFWFARGFEAPLPSFDQEVASAAAAADLRSWRDHVEDFRSVREASLTLFAALPDDSWGRRGVASGHLVTVRALAYITAGHLNHHIGILKERYLTRP